MKLQVVSDLHLDFHVDEGRGLVEEITAGDYDLLVVAGDLSAAPALEASLRLLVRCSQGRHVLYVPGNHDYYHSHREATQAILARMVKEAPGTLTVLDNSMAYIQGKLFVGSTLWFLWPAPAATDVLLGDFRHIHGLSTWVNDVSRMSEKFLQDKIREDSIVVTHHSPHSRCMAPRFAGNILNRYFIHDLGDVVGKPKLWIHGHTHDSLDVRVGGCQVICNPFGYARVEENKAFKPNLNLLV